MRLFVNYSKWYNCILDALKDLLGGTIKEMMKAEIDEHLGYEKSKRSDSDDYRNVYKAKHIISS